MGRAHPRRQHARPLPPLLWQRLDGERHAAHERALTVYVEAAGEARELIARARQAAVDDEAALRTAVAEGAKVPKPKAPTAETAAAEAQRAAEMAARLVLKSGGRLAAELSDDDVVAAITEAREQAAGIVAGIPELVDRLLAELAEAGRLGAEAQWCGGLVERRIQQPWRPASRPASHRLAQAAQHAAEVKVYAEAEVTEREWQAAGPPEHRAPAGAPDAGTWTAGEVDVTR